LLRHSFPVEKIGNWGYGKRPKNLGRWKSSAYHCYIQNLDPENRFVSLKTAETLLRNFCAGKKTGRRARIIESSDESEDDSSDSDSSSGSDDEESLSPPSSNKNSGYKIPKRLPGEEWTESELDNFSKMYPYLKNLENLILKKASLRDITSMGSKKS